jgi:uncharacterized protein (TIGR02246 family)
MRALTAVAVGLGAWLAPLTAGAQALSAADVAKIHEVTQTLRRSALARDWETFAAAYTEDAVLYAPNTPAVKGRAAIRAWAEKFPRLTELDLENVKIEGQGDLAYVLGVYRMTMSAPGSADLVKDTGKFIEIRRKQPDGRWLLVADVSNSDLPAPSPPK